jgi:hypothetical protein
LPHLSGNPCDRASTDTDCFSDLQNARTTRQRLADGALASRIQFRAPYRFSALRAFALGAGDTGSDPLSDHRSLKFGEHAQHLKHGSARRGRGV